MSKLQTAGPTKSIFSGGLQRRSAMLGTRYGVPDTMYCAVFVDSRCLPRYTKTPGSMFFRPAVCAGAILSSHLHSRPSTWTSTLILLSLPPLPLPTPVPSLSTDHHHLSLPSPLSGHSAVYIAIPILSVSGRLPQGPRSNHGQGPLPQIFPSRPSITRRSRPLYWPG
jgi:hypothetical protein